MITMFDTIPNDPKLLAITKDNKAMYVHAVGTKYVCFNFFELVTPAVVSERQSLLYGMTNFRTLWESAVALGETTDSLEGFVREMQSGFPRGDRLFFDHDLSYTMQVTEEDHRVLCNYTKLPIISYSMVQPVAGYVTDYLDQIETVFNNDLYRELIQFELRVTRKGLRLVR